MRILLVEDSKRLQHAIVTGLRRMGYAVDVTGDGAEGLWMAQSNPYDVLILDLMLPGMDGMTVLKNLRDEGNEVHVLILTAKDAVPDRVAGLRAGADDYLPKPFDFDELVARVEALARRSYGKKSPQLTIGPLTINMTARVATLDDQVLPLTAREYSLLEFLALRVGEVVSRTEIEERIYDERAEPMSNVVDAAICVLRRKIDVPGQPSLIQTRRGQGYILALPAAEPQE